MGLPKRKIDTEPIGNQKITKGQSINDKADIERLKNILVEKLKDPKLAKKASLIIAEMLSTK